MSTTQPSPEQTSVYGQIARFRCQERELSDNFVLPPPAEDPLPKWNLWTDLDSVKVIIIGLLHSDSDLGPDQLAAILHARNPSAYGNLTGGDVESIFSWLRNNPDAPDNPYKTIFNKQPGDDATSNVYVVMRASILLGLVETEAGVPRAKEKAQERLGALEYSADVLDMWNTLIRDAKERQAREAEQQQQQEQKPEPEQKQEQESAEKVEETETQRVNADEETKEETAGTDDE